jgi:hypothetical protein
MYGSEDWVDLRSHAQICLESERRLARNDEYYLGVSATGTILTTNIREREVTGFHH